jgi:hypothetical protein
MIVVLDKQGNSPLGFGIFNASDTTVHSTTVLSKEALVNFNGVQVVQYNTRTPLLYAVMS